MYLFFMLGIVLLGFFLGFLVDKLGCKFIIIIGLVLFVFVCYSFLIVNDFVLIVSLMSLFGVVVGIFKIGVLVFIGDILILIK